MRDIIGIYPNTTVRKRKRESERDREGERKRGKIEIII